MENSTHVCCVKGHSPENLPFGGKESIIDVYKIKIALYQEIDKAIDNGYTCFMNDACRGVNFWATQYILQKRKRNPNIQLKLVVNCDEPIETWCCNDLQTYNSILLHANGIPRFGCEYTHDFMQIKHIYMINKSSLLLAVWNGQASNTKNCIDFAKHKGIKTTVINIEEKGYRLSF